MKQIVLNYSYFYGYNQVVYQHPGICVKNLDHFSLFSVNHLRLFFEKDHWFNKNSINASLKGLACSTFERWAADFNPTSFESEIVYQFSDRKQSGACLFNRQSNCRACPAKAFGKYQAPEKGRGN